MNESLYEGTSEKVLNIQLSQKLGFTKERNLADITIRMFYVYADKPDVAILDIEVQNIYEIPGLDQFIVGDSEIQLPQPLIATLLDTSISHTRALLAKNIAGTVFQENLLNIVDPHDVAAHFYPETP